MSLATKNIKDEKSCAKTQDFLAELKLSVFPLHDQFNYGMICSL